MEVSLSLLGFGNVGRGFLRTLLEKSRKIRELYGIEFRVVSISDSSATVWSGEGVDLSEALAVKETFGALSRWGDDYEVYELSPTEVAREVESDVFIDVTSANPEAYRWQLEALRHGRHVVTSNKPPLVFHYGELTNEAERRGLEYRFEATVMAGTPIIALLRENLMGDEVIGIEGVLNGTTTFILSEMEKGTSFEEALRRAQELGIAEANPEGDTKGLDAAYKAAILHNVAFGKFDFSRAMVEGIDSIGPDGVMEAKRRGKVIRLISTVEKGVVEVKPVEVPVGSPLAVHGTSNVALIKSDLLGELTLRGAGAGVKETVSGVLSDVIRCALKTD
ncbi:homoserine dehydrogenase [Palaeococcus ferrophilus]|uniref:homoserine dehydrogenase n=1 Tax=Palaeococcus ferrophilus TaxID=83868 RepID=UPI00064F8AB2|nr:homoserine dehydrogenase [Palaeococcus ferrophilus]